MAMAVQQRHQQQQQRHQEQHQQHQHHQHQQQQQPDFHRITRQSTGEQGLMDLGRGINMVEYQQLLQSRLMQQHAFLKQQQQQLLQHESKAELDGGSRNNLILPPPTTTAAAAGGGRKRPREYMDAAELQRLHQRQISQASQVSQVSEYRPQHHQQQQQQQQEFGGVVSTGLQLGLHHNASAMTTPTAEASSLPAAVSSEVLTQLQQHRSEFDQYLRLQQDKIRAMVADKWQQNSRMLLGTIEKYMARCLKERAMKVEDMNRRNKELEEKLRQLSVEALMWQKQARDYEGLVTTLRNNLQVVTLTRDVLMSSREGCGDSSEAAAATSASSYHDGGVFAAEEKNKRTCRICRSRDVCILLLPCQHLCLCKDCEALSQSQSCPICATPKHASFQVFMA